MSEEEVKRLKEVGQSSRERKKWLIMLWYVVFSETAEKMKKIKREGKFDKSLQM